MRMNDDYDDDGDCDDDGRLISATRVINNITAQSSELAV